MAVIDTGSDDTDDAAVPEPDTDVLVHTPFQVRFDGRNYVGGERVKVPRELAALWERNSWATIEEAEHHG